MESITAGNLLTILTIVIGLVIQYVAIITKFAERLTKLEVKQEHYDKDINEMFKVFREIIQTAKSLKFKVCGDKHYDNECKEH